jgi:threonyl-tRNA synthetase
VREAGLPGKGSDAIVVVKDAEGHLRDLSWTPQVDVEVEAVAADTEDGRSVIRHSAAHVLAQAVQQQFPGAKLGIGPPVKDGFYYDFQVEKPFTPEDLQALEKRMKQTFGQVRNYAAARKCDWRTASYAIGLERLRTCYNERGIFP